MGNLKFVVFAFSLVEISEVYTQLEDSIDTEAPVRNMFTCLHNINFCFAVVKEV